MSIEMKIDKWFGNDHSAERKTAVRNVIGIMLADGKIDPRERTVLKAVCKRVGITEQEVADLMGNLGSSEFVAAKDDRERVLQLCDMVFMMLADGKIDKSELVFCMAAACRLGFHPKVVEGLIAKIVKDVNQGHLRKNVTKDVADFLKG